MGDAGHFRARRRNPGRGRRADRGTLPGATDRTRRHLPSIGPAARSCRGRPAAASDQATLRDAQRRHPESPDPRHRPARPWSYPADLACDCGCGDDGTVCRMVGRERCSTRRFGRCGLFRRRHIAAADHPASGASQRRGVIDRKCRNAGVHRRLERRQGRAVQP